MIPLSDDMTERSDDFDALKPVTKSRLFKAGLVLTLG